MIVFLVQGFNTTAANVSFFPTGCYVTAANESVDYPTPTSSNAYVNVSSGVKATTGTTGNGNLTASANADRLYGVLVALRPATTAPTVTTQAVSSIGTTTATGNGNVTALGTPNPLPTALCGTQRGTRLQRIIWLIWARKPPQAHSPLR